MMNLNGKKNEKETTLKITVQPVEGEEGEYLAYFSSGFLQATFSVLIRDNIFGAMALNRFADMIRKEYGDHFKTDRVEIEIADGLTRIRNKTLAETLILVPRCA